MVGRSPKQIQIWCCADLVSSVSASKELKAFFKDQPIREISTRDCERFKSMLGKAETLRNELRSGSTVNRYMALLSGMCKRAIKEELLDANPCKQNR
jgi:integrase-like protein